MTTPRNTKHNLCILEILKNLYCKVHEDLFSSFGGDNNNELHHTGGW